MTNGEIEKIIKEKLSYLKDLEKEGKDSHYFKELSDLALLQLELGQFSEAESNFSTCLKHFKNLKDKLGQAAIQGILGTLFFKKGEYHEAIEHYKKANIIYQERNQISELIMCLKGIGNSFIKLNHLDDACDIFLECSAICSDTNDIYSLLDCLGNLVYIHETLEKWDVVEELYKKSLAAFKELNDSKGIIVSNFNLGILGKKNRDYDKALIFFKEGTNQAIDSNYAELIIKGLGYIGETLFYLGKVKEAKNEFIRALKLAQEIDAKNAIIQLKILLKSFGLDDNDIKQELKT